MANTAIIDRKTIEKFLTEMKGILNSGNFNIDRDFHFVVERNSDDPDDEYNNTDTMLELGYDTADVVEELKTLDIKEYSESMLDTVDTGVNFLHVFGRTINGRDVYIKVRLKANKKGTTFVLCISFHFARHKIINFPYK